MIYIGVPPFQETFKRFLYLLVLSETVCELENHLPHYIIYFQGPWFPSQTATNQQGYFLLVSFFSTKQVVVGKTLSGIFKSPKLIPWLRQSPGGSTISTIRETTRESVDVDSIVYSISSHQLPWYHGKNPACSRVKNQVNSVGWLAFYPLVNVNKKPLKVAIQFVDLRIKKLGFSMGM